MFNVIDQKPIFYGFLIQFLISKGVVFISKLIIYSSVQNPKNAVSLIETAFKQKKCTVKVNDWKIDIINKKLFSKETINIEVLLRENALERFEAKIERLTTMLSSEKYKDKTIKNLALMQTIFINEIILIETDFADSYKDTFNEISNKLCALTMLSDETILNMDGKDIVDAEDFYIYVAGSRLALPEVIETVENRNRRKDTLKKLEHFNIPLIEVFPLLPDSPQVTMRTRDEICERTVSQILFTKYACDISEGGDLKECREQIVELLNKYEVMDALTHKEQQFLFSDIPDIKYAIEIMWQYEASLVLLWVLGYIDDLYFPDKACDSGFAINTVLGFDFYDDFFDNSTLKNKADILDNADFALCLYWACLSVKTRKSIMPNNAKEEVVFERAKIFNWLLNLT